MSDSLWSRVAARLAEHEYMTGVERTVERVYATGEVFTPTELVLEIVQYLDLELWPPAGMCSIQRAAMASSLWPRSGSRSTTTVCPNRKP